MINRWMGREDARFYEYYDRFVQPFEPITRERVYVSRERYTRIVEWQQHSPYGAVPYDAIFEGGDPEDVDDHKDRVILRLTPETIAARFRLSSANTIS